MSSSTTIAMLALFFLLVGCDTNYQVETALIEEAETLYVRGEFDQAGELYREFIELYPRSPWAGIASQRVRLIDRELNAIMGQPGMPTPRHVAAGSGDRLVGEPHPADTPASAPGSTGEAPSGAR